MAKKRHTPEQVINKLRGAEVAIAEGGTAAEAARRIGLTEQTFYRWRSEYGGLRITALLRQRGWHVNHKREAGASLHPGSVLFDALSLLIPLFCSRLTLC